MIQCDWFALIYHMTCTKMYVYEKEMGVFNRTQKVGRLIGLNFHEAQILVLV